jgi:hypothetical protein
MLTTKKINNKETNITTETSAKNLLMAVKIKIDTFQRNLSKISYHSFQQFAWEETKQDSLTQVSCNCM